MGRVAVVTAAIDEAGNRVGGPSQQGRIYDDFLCTTPSVVTDDVGGGTVIAQPITPNSGAYTPLALTTAAIDTTIQVVSTAGFALGQLVTVYDGVNTVYRFIRGILAGPPRLTLASAIGFIFSSANTQVGNLDQVGVIGGFVTDATFHYLQMTDTGSGRVMPPTLMPTMIAISAIGFMEEGVLVGTRPTVNFIGAISTAVDNPGASRVDVTFAAAFSMLTGALSAAQHGALGAIASAHAFADIANAISDAQHGARGAIANAHAFTDMVAGAISDAQHGVRAIANAHGFAQISGALSAAQHGALGAITSAHAFSDLAGVITDTQHGARTVANAHQYSQIGGYPTLTTATAKLSADVTMTTVSTYYDGPSVSLAAGTWFVEGHVTIQSISDLAPVTAKLWDGTTVSASAQSNMGANGAVEISVSAIVVLGGTTTIKISATVGAGGGGDSIKAAAPTNGAGNNASIINATRVA
jgi:hypothetical protein